MLLYMLISDFVRLGVYLVDRFQCIHRCTFGGRGMLDDVVVRAKLFDVIVIAILADFFVLIRFVRGRPICSPALGSFLLGIPGLCRGGRVQSRGLLCAPRKLNCVQPFIIHKQVLSCVGLPGLSDWTRDRCSEFNPTIQACFLIQSGLFRSGVMRSGHRGIVTINVLVPK